METNYLIYIVFTLILIILFIYYLTSITNLKKMIIESNDNVKLLKNELEKISATESNIKQQLSTIENEQFIDKKEISNLNQITSFSQLNHDIRTQLNGIIAFSNLLETETKIKENKDLIEYASNIRISGENLLKLFS